MRGWWTYSMRWLRGTRAISRNPAYAWTFEGRRQFGRQSTRPSLQNRPSVQPLTSDGLVQEIIIRVNIRLVGAFYWQFTDIICSQVCTIRSRLPIPFTPLAPNVIFSFTVMPFSMITFCVTAIISRAWRISASGHKVGKVTHVLLYRSLREGWAPY